MLRHYLTKANRAVIFKAEGSSKHNLGTIELKKEKGCDEDLKRFQKISTLCS